jgi:hypothetical protein
MPATEQSQAIGMANQAIAIMGQFQALRATVNEFVTQYNDQGTSTIWNNLGTVAQNTDGSLGAADGSPNTAHPINTGTYTTLNRATSAATLENAVALMEAFQSFLTNSAVATANRNAVLDLFIGS